MKKLWGAVAVYAAVFTCFSPVGVSQTSAYVNPSSANPFARLSSRKAPAGYQSPTESYYYGNANVRNPYAAGSAGISAAPASAPAEDEGQTAAATAPIVEEEKIPPSEQPRGNAVMTIPAETAPAGSVSYLNRKINFPRDRGDDIEVLKLQVFLDYHGYSPGEIDGKWGYNTERALYVYQKNNAMANTGQLDDRIQARLNSFRDGYLLEYTISQKDVSGPYFYIPRDYYAQAKMKFLAYESALEAIAEKFHCSQSLLQKLNPGVDFTALRPGQTILGLNVIDGIDDKRGKVALVRISRNNKWTETFDAQGRFMFYYPSTVGDNRYDPLPLGTWQVASEPIYNPPFKYQPKLFWDDDPKKPEAMIPPGPNSPVGSVWIGTSRKSVGIHGTPNPENISRNTSHGCIRLANWDAMQLAKRVSAGTKLEFVQ